LIKYGADYGGMVLFFPKSKRNIDIERARVLVKLLKKSDIKTVAVVVSPTVEQLELIEGAGFDYIQIHGELSDEVYDKAKINIIRAVNIKAQDLLEIKADIDVCKSRGKITGILLDAGVPGSGKTFDWNSVNELELSGIRFFLAGGLNPNNVREAIKTVNPQVVDISSGVEFDDPAIIGKDEDKVKAFIQNAKMI